MRRPSLVLSSILVLSIAACGGGAAQPTGSSPGGGTATTKPEATKPVEGQATPGTSLTACQLVAPADIEAALELDAGTVGEGELKQQGTVLDPAVNECRYTGDWGGLIVNATPTDGVNVFDALVSSFGDDAEKLQLGDGALWFEDNNRGYFLQGPVMVRLQFTHIASGVDSFRDPTIAIGTAALAKL